MLINKTAVLKLAGLEEGDLRYGGAKKLEPAQVMLLAAFYVGNKLEDLEHTLDKVYDSVVGVREAVEELERAWQRES